MASCKSCGAPIRWVEIHPGGRKMPLDPEAAGDGNVLVDWNTEAGVVLSEAMKAEVLRETPDEPLYRSHFASCPDALEWRRTNIIRSEN